MPASHEPLISSHKNWHVLTTVEKYHEDLSLLTEEERSLLTPYESRSVEGNLLVTAGITALLTLLIGGGGTAFNNANAHLGVGDSATAAAIGQTDLQAATNKLRKAMDATYPSVATNVLTARSTFATGDANWVWNEWGLFNAAAAGTMLNRKVESLGTKTTGSWVLTVTITIT
jgi:hypothetical protein